MIINTDNDSDYGSGSVEDKARFRNIEFIAVDLGCAFKQLLAIISASTTINNAS